MLREGHEGMLEILGEQDGASLEAYARCNPLDYTVTGESAWNVTQININANY